MKFIVSLSDAELANLSDVELARREEQLNHLELLTRESATGFTTSDGRDKTEVCEAKIAGSTSEEERAHHRANLKRNWPRAEILGGKDVPFWDKRDLVKLYEEISFKGSAAGIGIEIAGVTTNFLHLQQLPIHHTTVSRSRFKHIAYGNKVVSLANEQVIEKVLYWHTATRNVTTTLKREVNRKKGISNHFLSVNWDFPLLLGSQHNNRFKRDTKVYVLSGEHKGRHGTVVGHGSGFDIRRWGSEIDTEPHYFTDNKSPLLKVVFCDKTGILKVHDIRQDTVKLVDLHDVLGFAFPSLSPWSSVNQYDFIETRKRKRTADLGA